MAKMLVPQERIELSTSPLPRVRSTTESLRHADIGRSPTRRCGGIAWVEVDEKPEDDLGGIEKSVNGSDMASRATYA